MLDYLRGKASERKLRLFAVACCRRIWDLLPDDASRQAVVIAECFVDGQASNADLHASRMAVGRRQPALVNSPDLDVAPAACQVVRAASARAVDRAVSGASFHSWYAVERSYGLRSGWGSVRENEERAQCHYLRDLFDNPFRPPSFDQMWRTPITASLAQATYDERIAPEALLDPARLSILADALEEAGCTNADILDHCRQPVPHVRGCWVVDLLLDRR
jgi:hypothetical protein